MKNVTIIIAIVVAVTGWVALSSSKKAPATQAESGMHPLVLDAQSFEEKVTQSSDVVLVDFFATWCGPCKVLAPTIIELTSHYDGRVVVGKVDVDQHQQLAKDHSIQSLPTLVIYKEGKEVERIIGLVEKSRIQGALDKHL